VIEAHLRFATPVEVPALLAYNLVICHSLGQFVWPRLCRCRRGCLTKPAMTKLGLECLANAMVRGNAWHMTLLSASTVPGGGGQIICLPWDKALLAD